MKLEYPNKEHFFGFEIEFPFRPAFFGLIHEIFLKPFIRIERDTAPMVVFDCGTNIGIRMLYFKWRYPHAQFVCFEPNPVVLEYLKRNIKNNNLSNDVTLHQVALGKEEGEIELFYHKNVRASGSASVIKPGTLGSDQTTITVPQRRLSDYIHSSIDMIKLDIEGAEGLVLEDLRDNKKLSFIKNIIIEFHIDDVTMVYPLEDIITILENDGFIVHHSPLEAFRVHTTGPILRTCMIYGKKQ
jgi:FkbM family methyltransferase